MSIAGADVEPGDRLELPTGAWVQLVDPDELTAADRDTLVDLAGKDPLGSATSQRHVIEQLVDSWSYDAPVPNRGSTGRPPAAVMPFSDYDALLELLDRVLDAYLRMFGVSSRDDAVDLAKAASLSERNEARRRRGLPPLPKSAEPVLPGPGPAARRLVAAATNPELQAAHYERLARDVVYHDQALAAGYRAKAAEIRGALRGV